ncbi:MAG TPA: hypothetical protein VGF67_34070 [Ktedonobacteraceae bacterium]|jgi:hypothetical protein
MKQILQRQPRRRLLTFLLLAVLPAFLLSLLPEAPPHLPLPHTSTLSSAEAGTGIQVRVDLTGTYTITARRPGWTFSGNVGHPLSSLTLAGGRDRLGRYQEIRFTYRGHVARADSIRTYTAHPTTVLLRSTYLAASSNSEPFPIFTTYPRALFHLSYHGSFGVYSFQLHAGDSPWLFFDAHANAFLLSAAANFLTADLQIQRDGSISSGISQQIRSLPQGFTQTTILSVGNSINGVYTAWGQALTTLSGKSRPGANPTLDRLGYWTDHGAAYYYHTLARQSYTDTLLASKRDFARLGIEPGYVQIDSWWYQKGTPPDWRKATHGIALYTADPTLFPAGLAAFARQLGLPLMVHARWIDPASPYRARYKMSGNVSVDPRYWQSIMSYLRQSGVIAYEQDWLSAQAQTALNLVDPDAFLSDMAGAAKTADLTLQYCMPTPGDYLQSALYSNVLTIRVSADRFARARWDDFLYDSRLASALGLWPWSDVFMSSERENLLLSTLAGGMVGIGDPVGTENRTNLLQAVRPDGVIVKPDTSIVPLDQIYVAGARGQNPAMVAAATSLHSDLVDAYVFAYSHQEHATQQAIITPASLGIAGAAYVYNYFRGTGIVVPAGQSFSATVGAGSYYIVAPLGPSGIAFLGDAGKFVSLGAKRISSLSDHGTVQATVSFARAERSVTLFGYAPARPQISANNGRVGPLFYNPTSHLFRVSVSAGTGQSAQITLSR